ncbi:MAG: choice-of-anchor U domain-containing protein, partial [Casimicrobium sp.]
NTAFNFSVASACTATDGDPITGYTVTSGTLPAGITLNGMTGLISGTPTAAGPSNVSIKCADVDGLSATAGALTITIAPQTNYSAPSATASGTITVAISGGGASCGFGVRQFIPVAGNAASPPIAPPAGTAFPHGLFDFTLKGCTPGSAVTLTVTYPAVIAAGTQYYKYGPTPSNAAATWYILPSTVSGSTVTFTITDGGLGDDDLSANGTIVDQGGPALQAVVVATPTVAVPALHPAMIALLALLLALVGRVSLGFSRRTF